MTEKRIKLVKTMKRGLPALWESGGGYSNTGFARVIALPDGTMPMATYIRRRGELACSDHALVTVKENYIVIEVDEHRGDISVKVYRIKNIYEDEEGDYYADIEEVFTNAYDAITDTWFEEVEPDDYLKDAIYAAIEKVRTYHCRYPVYVQEPVRKKKDNAN